MKYSDYIKCPTYGVMVYKDDVRLIASELTKEGIFSRYEWVRDDMEELHGDKYFQSVQNVAFLSLFSSLDEYREILE